MNLLLLYASWCDEPNDKQNAKETITITKMDFNLIKHPKMQQKKKKQREWVSLLHFAWGELLWILTNLFLKLPFNEKEKSLDRDIDDTDADARSHQVIFFFFCFCCFDGIRGTRSPMPIYNWQQSMTAVSNVGSLTCFINSQMKFNGIELLTWQRWLQSL